MIFKMINAILKELGKILIIKIKLRKGNYHIITIRFYYII